MPSDKGVSSLIKSACAEYQYSQRRVCFLENSGSPQAVLAPVPTAVSQSASSVCAVNRQQRHRVQEYPDERPDSSEVSVTVL